MTSKEIEKASKAAIATVVPEYLKIAGPQAGLEQMERSDMTLPRLAICQAMSPQRKRSDAKYIEGLSEGDIFNTITNTNYGTHCRVVPLLFFKQRIRFGKMDEGGGVLCQAPDNVTGVGDPGGVCAQCALSTFGTDGGRPECNQFFNYAVLVMAKGEAPRADSLAVLSLKSTGLRIARDWNALMRLRGTDAFAGIYELGSAEQKNNLGTWYVPTIKNGGWVTEQAYNLCKDAYTAVKGFAAAGKLRVDVADLEGSEEEREPGADG